MCSHLYNILRCSSLALAFWVGLLVMNCDAQMFWQMVHENDEDGIEKQVLEQQSKVESTMAVNNVPVGNLTDDMQSQSSIERGWRENITATIFWIGEKACRANPVHNKASSWDMRWVKTFGGVDHPYKRSGFYPKGFKPKANPFYIALPYNDIGSKTHKHKKEASKVIWWYKQQYRNKYISVCKGKWVAIKYGDKICYAQWQDCGPFLTNDWEYVFKGKRPKTTKNNSAGIDLSPAIRDYLKLQSGEKVSWKFVEESEVEHGPWSKWSKKPIFLTTNP